MMQDTLLHFIFNNLLRLNVLHKSAAQYCILKPPHVYNVQAKIVLQIIFL